MAEQKLLTHGTARHCLPEAISQSYLMPEKAGFLGNNGRISKVAVDLVDRVNFRPSLKGRIKAETIVYRTYPELRKGKDHSTLEQSETFANLNPSVRVGDEVIIDAREGNDYIVEIRLSGKPGMGKLGRIPVSAIDIVSGNPSSGARVVVPPLPQSENPNAAG